MPERQEISTDTQLLLQAIGSVEHRIERLEVVPNDTKPYFEALGDEVCFSNETKARIGDDIYDLSPRGTAQDVGVLVDIHPRDARIFIKEKSGKVTPFYAFSVKSKQLSSVPF